MPRECISNPEKLVSHFSFYITLRTTTTFYRNPVGLAWVGVVAVTVDTETDQARILRWIPVKYLGNGSHMSGLLYKATMGKVPYNSLT